MKDLEKMIDKLARQAMDPYFYTGNIENAVSRLLDYILYEGGGHKERAEFMKVLHKSIMDKISDNETGEEETGNRF